jgi:osmotically-inducible protein OsmY|tara:strand:+ start:6960 stop:7163 length:204 start_codon:yes stop_codon:yes gene_type:complete
MKEQLYQKVERIVHQFGFANVRVTNGKTGQVTLSGSVSDINDRALVVAIARTTPGVQEIHSEITVTK